MDNIFDISFAVNGQQYTGWVNPSDKLDENKKPVSFHVVLQQTSFGYLSKAGDRWVVNEERPAALVDAIGCEIEKVYP